jgi:hypothetical protein
VVECQQVLLCNTWLLCSGDAASSQVRSVRIAKRPRRGRLDGFSGVGATPAKAGDPLVARSPRNVRGPGDRSLAIALGAVAARTGFEFLRRRSWDVAPVDAEGAPC